jgi:hypothetical protein
MEILTVDEGYVPTLPTCVCARKQDPYTWTMGGSVASVFPWMFHFIEEGEVKSTCSSLRETPVGCTPVSKLFVLKSEKGELIEYLRQTGFKDLE